MRRLRKVISGGQTGADQAGLAAALAHGLETGGWAPKGYRTLTGDDPLNLRRYNLREHQSRDYGPRTDLNVREADGTIRLARTFDSPGERRTLKAILRFRKPYLDVNMLRPRMPGEVVLWLDGNDISVLNVAGNSEQTAPGIYEFVFDYLSKVFTRALRSRP